MLSLAFTAAGVAGADWLLGVMHTPPEVLPLAASYLRLVFCSFASMYCSFLCMSMLRAIGNTESSSAPGGPR